eukprot:6206309-Pleurochrysis_carterae.AAC.1
MRVFTTLRSGTVLPDTIPRACPACLCAIARGCVLGLASGNERVVGCVFQARCAMSGFKLALRGHIG